MNPRLPAPPETGHDAYNESSSHGLNEPGTGCAALAAMSPLAARTVLRACAAWGLLETATQACLLRRVSSGQEGAAARAALAALLESAEWKSGRYVHKSALERLAAVTSLPTWFSGPDVGGPH